MSDSVAFVGAFRALTGNLPMCWQKRLFARLVEGDVPSALDLPTGLGKTATIAIWLIARALAEPEALGKLPRRLAYVVDRRAVVDQATAEAEKLRCALDGEGGHLERLTPEEAAAAGATLAGLKRCLGLGDRRLRISTLRGQFVDNRDWLADPASCAIIVGTVDMIGSRLLFSGYGVSPKMRPFQAGLLGADTLLVLDEAHLVPPFAALARSIEADKALWPAERGPIPPFLVLPLSATPGGSSAADASRRPFGLATEDEDDEVAGVRLKAHKVLRVEPLADKDHDRRLAEVALALATENGPRRVLVFCNRRDRRDEGAAGPSAQGVAEAIEHLAKGDRKTGRERIDIEPPELLVGGRRVHEREQAAERLRALGFIGGSEPPPRPAFLVATAAGEVGVDIDADDMVMDLVPWERLVQRLGRVNRRGKGNATVVLFDTASLEKDAAGKARLEAALTLLRQAEGLSPADLANLTVSAGKEAIAAASTPVPLHPALTRPLADAWSMTTLDADPGRPEIEPWLRGWVENDQPQTTLLWRRWLPVRADGKMLAKADVEAFFDAAPTHVSERLETETFRVADWLAKRAAKLVAGVAPPADADGDDDEADVETSPVPADEPASGSGAPALQRDDLVAVLLSPADVFKKAYKLADLVEAGRGRAKEDFLRDLAGQTLVLDVRFGGLDRDGMLDETESVPSETADEEPKWSKEAGFRVWLKSKPSGSESPKEAPSEEDWSREAEFVVRADADGDPLDKLVIEHFRDKPQGEDGKSTAAQAQELGDHQRLAEARITGIARALGLSDVAIKALCLAARLHDEGKKAPNWQRAFHAPRDAEKFGLVMPLAKTRGPVDQQVLGGYRHEFGSLRAIEDDCEFRDGLPSDWQDLVLHIVAAHHGRARPTISTEGAMDAPPSALAERARDVALRFARLQQRWGPWGLAWWESLLRAADQQASRDNDREADTAGVPEQEAARD